MSDSAVLEQEAPAVNQEPYKSPMPEVGARVRWYANGDMNNKPQPAYVLDVFPQTNMVRLQVVSEPLAPIKTPFHISDPRVKAQPNAVRIESRGTWDFSTEHYHREAFEAEVKQSLATALGKIAELESLLDGATKPARKRNED